MFTPPPISICFHCKTTLCVSVIECKGQSTCRGGLRRLVSIAAQSQPKQTTVHWHGEQGNACVCVYLTVCMSAFSSHPFCPACSKNNPLLSIFNPQVTTLSSLCVALYHTLTHLMCDSLEGGGESPSVKPAKTQA